MGISNYNASAHNGTKSTTSTIIIVITFITKVQPIN